MVHSREIGLSAVKGFHAALSLTALAASQCGVNALQVKATAAERKAYSLVNQQREAHFPRQYETKKQVLSFAHADLPKTLQVAGISATGGEIPGAENAAWAALGKKTVQLTKMPHKDWWKMRTGGMTKQTVGWLRGQFQCNAGEDSTERTFAVTNFVSERGTKAHLVFHDGRKEALQDGPVNTLQGLLQRRKELYLFKHRATKEADPKAGETPVALVHTARQVAEEQAKLYGEMPGADAQTEMDEAVKSFGPLITFSLKEGEAKKIQTAVDKAEAKRKSEEDKAEAKRKSEAKAESKRDAALFKGALAGKFRVDPETMQKAEAWAQTQSSTGAAMAV